MTTAGSFGGFGGGGAWTAGYSRITFSGVFGSVAAPFERWSFRLHLNARGTKAENDALAAAASGYWQTHLAPRVALPARLSEVKVASLDANGQYSLDPSIAAVDVAGGAASSEYKAPQLAMAVSLVTARRGPTGKGRFYLPSPVIVPSLTTGLQDAIRRDAYQAGAAGFISAINAQAHPGSVCVVSTKGYHSDVTAVRVGSRPDVIRSRAGQIAEAFAAPTPV